MTTPLPVDQATLDAAVDAAMDALCAVQWPALPGDTGPLVPVDHIARAAVTAALPVLAAAIERQARADGAAAERERCVGVLSRGVESQHLSDTAKKWLKYARSTVQADASHRDSAAAIARAGTSEPTTA